MKNDYEMTLENEMTLDLQLEQAELDMWEAEMKFLDSLDNYPED